jgi:rhamnose utilization protein RhaD (predicted bifunctional aldolase and dehydrogenase)
MIDNKLRKQVETFCQKISKDRLIVQGAGGNVSWKTNQHLWIKISGSWIEEAGKKDIFGSIQLDKLYNRICQKNFSIGPNLMDQKNLRPSIEVMLHAIIKKRFVFHLHMVEVVSELINNPQKLISKLKKHNLDVKIIPYRMPGEELAREIYYAIYDQINCDILFLENHGVVLFSDELNDIQSQIELIQSLCHKEISDIDSVSRKDTLDIYEAYAYRLLDDLQTNILVFKKDIFSRLDKLWPICPDHLVFLGPRPYLCSSDSEFQQLLKVSPRPLLIFYKNQGIYVDRDIFKNIHFIQLQSFVDILVRLDDYEDVPVISNDEIRKLLNFDAEKYRQNINN